MTDATVPASNPLGDVMAQAVDTSVNRRIGPIRRAVKRLLDTVKGHDDKLATLSKEVDELKKRPQVDPMALLTEAVGSAKKTLEDLDAKAVEEIEKDLQGSLSSTPSAAEPQSGTTE